MYGTVAHFKLKPGKRDDLIALLHRQTMEEERFISGAIASFLYSLDSDPDRVIMIAIFDSPESYRANADSPAQRARYRDLRALLADDPEWHDGHIETYTLAEGANLNSAAYGTVAHMLIKPDSREALDHLTRRHLAKDPAIPGHLTSYVLEEEANPGVVYLVVVFDSHNTYRANAESPQQHERYLELRELMAADPVWYDGKITAYVRF